MSFQSNGGGALFTGQLSYATVHNNNGQTFVPNTGALLTIDTVEHLSSDFTAAVGDDKLTVTRPGIYLVQGDAWGYAGPIASGIIDALLFATGDSSNPMVYRNPCPAALSDRGEGFSVGIWIVPAAGAYFRCGITQTDTVDQVLGADMFAVRLGDLPS